jgi:NAD(P)-dependent dehydrogenase (short-subunit alcohol dehydrogenase family)
MPALCLCFCEHVTSGCREFAHDLERIASFERFAIQIPFPGMAHYASSKGGVIGLTRALSIELAPAVRVNAICLGTIRTALTRALYPTEKALESAAEDRTPAGRIGEPEDIAEAAPFLSSAASSHISGTIVSVAGGGIFH